MEKTEQSLINGTAFVKPYAPFEIFIFLNFTIISSFLCISIFYFLLWKTGCGGYVNGDGEISISLNQSETIGDVNSSEDVIILSGQCFWFIEARHVDGTLLLWKDNGIKRKGMNYFPELDNPIIV